MPSGTCFTEIHCKSLNTEKLMDRRFPWYLTGSSVSASIHEVISVTVCELPHKLELDDSN